MHFFTDIDSLLSQNANNEFGSITTTVAGQERFQLTSVHNCTNNAKAYAITDAFMAVQPDSSNPLLVNVILKPTDESSIGDSKIKFIIYRGIKKDSIFDTNGKLKLSGSGLSDQILITKNNLEAKFPNLAPIDPIPGVLGFGIDFETDLLTEYPAISSFVDLQITSIFLKLNSEFKGFPIKAGLHLGNFQNKIGIDIIFRDHKLPISVARASELFVLSDMQTGLTGTALFDKRAEKEVVYDYLDICHYLTLGYSIGGLKVKNVADSTFRTISAKDDSANEILTILSQFNNQDKMIVDIRNEHKQSFNYYNNVTDPIKNSFTNSGFTNTVYPDWPLWKITFQPAINNSLFLKIPVVDINNAQAYYRENYTESPKFRSITFYTNYSQVLEFRLPQSPNGTSLPGYFNLRFIREVDAGHIPIQWVIRSRYFIDNLFDIEELVYTDTTPDLQVWGFSEFENPTKWVVNEESSFVQGLNDSFMAKTGIAEDANFLYFFAFSNGEALENSSAEIMMVSGDSVKDDFFEDIILPLFDNTLSVLSYEATVGANTYSILKDNINNRDVVTQVKLVPNRKDFVLLAIDKQSNLAHIKTAYLNFQNEHPKRLILSDRTQIIPTTGDPFWVATVKVIGYSNNTVTNNYEIKEVDTGIKIRYYDEDQKVFGTEAFNNNYVVGAIELNGADFYGRIFQNFRYSLRDAHPDIAGVTPVVLGKTGRNDVNFKVLGKCRPNASNPHQYYIELTEDVVDWDDPSTIIASGTRCFVSSLAFPHIIAKFDRFQKVLKALNDTLDVNPNSAGDTIEERVTRLRQRGHSSDVDLFNDVIGKGGSLVGTVYSDQITYVTGSTTNVTLTNVGNPSVTVTAPISTDLQLYLDFVSVEFSNGNAAEIQHLFVGLDVIGNPLINNSVVLAGGGPFTITRTIPNNIHISLHSGDAGTVPNPTHDFIVDDAEIGIDSREAIVELFDTDPLTLQGTNPLNTRFYRHFQSTQFPLEDQYGDFYSFGLYFGLFQTAIVFSSGLSAATPTNLLNTVFQGFNDDPSAGEYDSVSQFFTSFGGDPNFDILNDSTSVNFPLYQELVNNTFVFAKIWRTKAEWIEIFDQDELDNLMLFSVASIREYINLINDVRRKHF